MSSHLHRLSTAASFSPSAARSQSHSRRCIVREKWALGGLSRAMVLVGVRRSSGIGDDLDS